MKQIDPMDFIALEKVKPEQAAVLRSALEELGIFNYTAYVFVDDIYHMGHGIACVYDLNEAGHRFLDHALGMASCRDVVW